MTNPSQPSAKAKAELYQRAEEALRPFPKQDSRQSCDIDKMRRDHTDEGALMSAATDFLELCKTDADFDLFSGGTFLANLESNIANAFQLIERDETTSALANQLYKAGQHMAASNGISKSRQAEFASAKERFLTLLDELMAAVERSPRSKRARNLSL